MTDSSPTILDRFTSMSMETKLLTIVGALIVIGAVTPERCRCIGSA